MADKAKYLDQLADDVAAIKDTRRAEIAAAAAASRDATSAVINAERDQSIQLMRDEVDAYRDTVLTFLRAAEDRP